MTAFDYAEMNGWSVGTLPRTITPDEVRTVRFHHPPRSNGEPVK
jgi:hypothetical protein